MPLDFERERLFTLKTGYHILEQGQSTHSHFQVQVTSLFIVIVENAFHIVFPILLTYNPYFKVEHKIIYYRHGNSSQLQTENFNKV